MYAGGPSSPACATRGEAHLPGPPEHVGELGRWVAHLAGVQPDRGEEMGKGSGLLERVQCRLLAQVTEEAQDQARRDPPLVRPVTQGAADTRDARLEGDAVIGVRLRVEEDLGMADALARRLGEVGGGEVVEVELREEHRAARIVDVEERRQIVEDVGAAELVHVGVGQRHLVPGGQLEGQLRLEGPLDVDVELGLGQLPDERVRSVMLSARFLHAAGQPPH